MVACGEGCADDVRVFALTKLTKFRLTELGQGVADPVPMAFCARRGGYGTNRLRKLLVPCPGVARRAADRTALCSAVAPKTTRPILDILPARDAAQRVPWDVFGHAGLTQVADASLGKRGAAATMLT
jgi:hypothetical protein